jgi:hypothetical protein
MNPKKTRRLRKCFQFFLLWILASFAASVTGQTRVQLQSGRYCTALAPAGWSWTGENPSGSVFGADIVRSDRRALASYYGRRRSPRDAHRILRARLPHARCRRDGGAEPARATVSIQCSSPRPLSAGQKMMSCRTPEYVGVALYPSYYANIGGEMRKLDAGRYPWTFTRSERSPECRTSPCFSAPTTW